MGAGPFWEKEQTKGEVKVFILDEVYGSLPMPPLRSEEMPDLAGQGL